LARDPFQPIRITEALRPQAAPVDTYVVPPQVQNDTSLADLARGLSTVSSSLDGFMKQRQERADQEDSIRAEADFHANNAQGYAEAVRQGLVPPQASRAYMEAYKRAEGDVAGARLQSQFRAAYDSWEGKSSTDPAAFDQFLAGFLKQNIGTDDPAVLRGLMPRLRSLAENANASRISDVANATRNRAVLARSAQVDNAITEGNANALQNRTQPNWRGVLGDITRIREEHIRAGGTPEEIDKQIVDAVTARAIDLRGEGPRLLETFFNSNVPGTNFKWGSTPYGRDSKAKAIESLERIGRQAQVEQRQARTEVERAMREDNTRKTINSILADPSKPIPDELIREGEKLDGDFRVKALGWQKTLLSGRGPSDPQVMTQLTWDIMNGGGHSTIRSAMDRGLIQNPEDLRTLNTLANQVQEQGKKVTDILGTSSARTILSTIKERTTSKDDLGALFAPDGVSDTGLAAQLDFRRQVLQWTMQNPRAGAIETEEAIAKIGQGILGRIGRTGPGGTETYTPEPGATNPFPANPGQPAQPTQPQAPAPQPAQPTQPPAAPPSGQRGAAPQAPNPANREAAMNWFEELPLDVRRAARTRAQQQGIPVESLAIEAWQRSQGQTPAARPPGDQRSELGDATVQPASFVQGVGEAVSQAIGSVRPEDMEQAPEVVRRVSDLITRAMQGGGQPQGGYASANLRDEPAAARILDFVAGPESRGNYNAVYGNARATEDLGQFTLDQILARQQAARRAGAESTAIGRYQFIFKTLSGLKARLGLDGTERFTPELQDRLAFQLLRDRGFDRWRSGQMPTETFANELAKEWAGLPNLRTGRSHYDGDGLNASGVSPRQVLAALGEAAGMPRSMTDGRPEGTSRPAGRFGPGDVYSRIPERDGRGEDQISKFLRWNPDPVGNHEANLNSVEPSLAQVVRRAQQANPNLRFVVGSGKRDAELQKEAVRWGWSRTEDSNHLDGNAVDIWPVDEQGRVFFEEGTQRAIAKAIKGAAAEMGVSLRWGGNFKSFRDLPHFELVRNRRSTTRA
jgi:muramidase (phage lysozyme)